MKKIKAYQIYVPLMLLAVSIFFIWGGLSFFNKPTDFTVWSFGSIMISVGVAGIGLAVYSIKDTIQGLKKKQ